MNAFDFLGIAHDADERSIKRAYAQRLKVARPDDDPVAFQRLHEAYHAALSWSRARTTLADANDDVADAHVGPDVPAAPHVDDGDATLVVDGSHDAVAAAPNGAPAPIPVDVAWTREDADAGPALEIPPEPVAIVEWSPAPTERVAAAIPVAVTDRDAARTRFEIDRFFARLCELAAAGDAGALRRWLDAQPELWSIATKRQVGPAVVDALGQHGVPMPDACFATLLAFFGLDDVQGGQDALAIERLRRQLSLRWDLMPEHAEWLARRVGQPNAVDDTRFCRRAVTRPVNRLRDVALAFVPGRPSAIARFLARLDGGRLHDLPPPIDPHQVDFWSRAADFHSPSYARFAVGGTRVLAAVAAAGLFEVFRALDGAGEASLVLVLALLYAVAWFAAFAWQVMRDWQSAPQSTRESGSRFRERLLFIPILAGLSIYLKYRNSVAFAAALALLALGLAIVRYRRRANRPPLRFHFSGWYVLLAIPIIKASVAIIAALVYFPEIACALAIGFWAVDLYGNRAKL